VGEYPMGVMLNAGCKFIRINSFTDFVYFLLIIRMLDEFLFYTKIIDWPMVVLENLFFENRQQDRARAQLKKLHSQ